MHGLGSIVGNLKNKIINVSSPSYMSEASLHATPPTPLHRVYPQISKLGRCINSGFDGKTFPSDSANTYTSAFSETRQAWWQHGSIAMAHELCWKTKFSNHTSVTFPTRQTSFPEYCGSIEALTLGASIVKTTAKSTKSKENDQKCLSFAVKIILAPSLLEPNAPPTDFVR